MLAVRKVGDGSVPTTHTYNIEENNDDRFVFTYVNYGGQQIRCTVERGTLRVEADAKEYKTQRQRCCCCITIIPSISERFEAKNEHIALREFTPAFLESSSHSATCVSFNRPDGSKYAIASSRSTTHA